MPFPYRSPLPLAIILGLSFPAAALGQYQVMEEAGESAPDDYRWTAERNDGGIHFTGNVPYRSVAEALLDRAGPGATEDLDIVGGAPLGFARDTLRLVDVLNDLESGAITLAEGEWMIEGVLDETTSEDDIEALLGAQSSAGVPWTITLAEQPSDSEPSVEPAPASADPDQAAAVPDVSPVESAEPVENQAPDDIAICRDRIGALMASQALLFNSGSARLTPQSEQLVAEAAEIFAVCPKTPIYVEGHTDTVGDQEANLVLSLLRAEAVVDELVEQGIAPDRLFAAGYGASLPIASNETAAGRSQNRRIVFSFEDIAGQTGGPEQ